MNEMLAEGGSRRANHFISWIRDSSRLGFLFCLMQHSLEPKLKLPRTQIRVFFHDFDQGVNGCNILNLQV